jgi:4-hydroxythreonine-4-phosphate dehydrogenase
MYHDQGLTAFKALSFEDGVNFSAGLPIVRTSPDHGTAFDIAGKNLASEASFRSAIYMAMDIYRNRKFVKQITENPLQIKTEIIRERREF